MKLVFFDFDGTLTRFDTTLPFAGYLARKTDRRARLGFFVLGWALIKLRLISNHGLKQIFTRMFLTGQSTPAIQDFATDFFRNQESSLFDDQLTGILKKHLADGDRVYLVSANFECLLHPLVSRWSLAGIIATQSESREGLFTGRMIGPACHGREKLRRVIDVFGSEAVKSAIAYGNADDAPLLQAVKNAFLVKPARPSGLGEKIKRCFWQISGRHPTAHEMSKLTIQPFPLENCSHPGK